MSISSQKLKRQNHFKGDRLQAKVIEHIEADEWILGVYGDLVRVMNSSGADLKPDQEVTLLVESVEPIRLKIIG